MKDSIRLLLPPLVWEAMHNLKKIGRSSVTDVSLPIGPFTLILPSTSYLPSLYTAQPYRNLAVGIIAKYAGEKYRDRCMVDVGANVGDTGAMMASYCSNPLVLVDPSDDYFCYLRRNASVFANPVTLVKGIVAGEGSVRGTLVHEGGTARIRQGGANDVGFEHGVPVFVRRNTLC